MYVTIYQYFMTNSVFLCRTILLLTDFEVNTGSYYPRFIRSDRVRRFLIISVHEMYVTIYQYFMTNSVFLCRTILLLTDFEVNTGSYYPRFIRIDRVRRFLIISVHEMYVTIYQYFMTNSVFLCNTILLLTDFEVNTGSYYPRFIRIDRV